MGTGDIVRQYLRDLPESDYRSLSAKQIRDQLKADKTVAAAMKKHTLSDSYLIGVISNVKSERGFAKAREKKKGASQAAEQPTLFVADSEASESSETPTDADQALSLGDALEIINKASGKFPMLSDAIKVAATHRQKLAEQQRQLDGLFGG